MNYIFKIRTGNKNRLLVKKERGMCCAYEIVTVQQQITIQVVKDEYQGEEFGLSSKVVILLSKVI